MKLRKKENLIYIFFGFVLAVVVIGIAVVITDQNQSKTKVRPSIDKNKNDASFTSPTPTPLAFFGNPPVRYDPDAQEKLLEKKINRTPLTSNDSTIKAKLLTYLPEGQVSGVIHETDTIRVEYLESLDLFKVEILTRDITGAKNEANTWFRQQGLSQKGICDLPLGFYLNWEIANTFRNTDLVFSPLANGC